MPIPKVLSDERVYGALLKEFGTSVENREGGRVLISAPYMMPNIDAFRRFFSERGHAVTVANVEERLEEKDLELYHGLYDVALIGDDRFSPRILKACGAKALSKWGTGIDSIDLDAARSLGIMIHNTPDAFSEPVAESILGAILAFNRTLVQSTAIMTNAFSGVEKGSTKADWVKLPGKTLREAKIAIVGFGNVGRALLRKLLSLGGGAIHPIITHDILETCQEEARKMGKQNFFGTDHFLTRPVQSLQEILESQPDFLCITCCQTKDNIAMLGESELQVLGPNTVVINMARGRLIDETALAKAIQEGRLGGADLDVYWDEPLPRESVLRSLSNVLLSSHNANSSPESWLKVHINTIRNALPYLEFCE